MRIQKNQHYLQHKMYNDSPIQRLYYFDTLFRRERPQKGRQRQFYQFGVEAIGSPHPEQDAEIISLAYNIPIISSILSLYIGIFEYCL